MDGFFPSIGAAQGKVWGSTQLLFQTPHMESHLIRVKKGGFCSKHKHAHKWNRFVVISGKLQVSIYREGLQSPDTTILDNDSVTDIPPGEIHKFYALEDTVAIEFYWTVLDSSDIDRGGTQGGILE